MANRQHHHDYIIVGLGIAGASLAWRLMAMGRRVLAIDAPGKNCCSIVAAGLFNPITEGRMMKKTWMADILFRALYEFYAEVERSTGRHFFHPMPLYRPFDSPGEQNDWMARSGDQDYIPFLEEVNTKSRFEGKVNDPFGGLLLRQSGYVNTSIFLDAIASSLKARGGLIQDFFEEDKLEFYEKEVVYGEHTAQKIVFCQGVHTSESKLFGWVPVTKLKGETLSIQADLPPGFIYNRGVYMVPEEHRLWKAGATYFYRDTAPGITTEGREELEMKLREWLRVDYHISKQDWGLRPASPDRRPILGAHPTVPRAFIFNGLGTKGVSLAPHFSEVFSMWLENQAHLNKEVKIERYKSLYSRSARL